MENTFFGFSDYKLLLRAYLKGKLGARLSMAELARKTGYQRSFVSRVLNGDLHLTPEGGFKVSEALNFSGEQTQFLSWLIEKARAGDPKYRAYAHGKAEEIRRQFEVRQKAHTTPVLNEDGYFLNYLRTWTGVAVHLATSVPELNTVSRIAERLSVPISLVEQTLAFLVEQNLVEKRKGTYHFSQGSVHLSNESPWVLLHHTNWRQRAMIHAQAQDAKSLHFTNVLTLTPTDRDQIRNVLLNSIEQVMKIATPSPPEDLVCMNLDFFRI